MCTKVQILNDYYDSDTLRHSVLGDWKNPQISVLDNAVTFTAWMVQVQQHPTSNHWNLPLACKPTLLLSIQRGSGWVMVYLLATEHERSTIYIVWTQYGLLGVVRDVQMVLMDQAFHLPNPLEDAEWRPKTTRGQIVSPLVLGRGRSRSPSDEYSRVHKKCLWSCHYERSMCRNIRHCYVLWYGSSYFFWRIYKIRLMNVWLHQFSTITVPDHSGNNIQVLLSTKRLLTASKQEWPLYFTPSL